MNQTPDNSNDARRPHPCLTCGRPTIFRHCDACYGDEVSRATTAPLPPLAQMLLRTRAMRLNHEANASEIGGPNDGDEFARTLAAWRREPERVPAARYWSGCCLWCAREIREQSGADQTHRPPLARIQTCYRHRKALLAFAHWLRNETHGKGEARHD